MQGHRGANDVMVGLDVKKRVIQGGPALDKHGQLSGHHRALEE